MFTRLIVSTVALVVFYFSLVGVSSSSPERIQGFNYHLGKDVAADLREQKQLGANWIALVVPCYQEPNGTAIDCSGRNTPSDNAVSEVVARAHASGLHVALKLHVTLTDGTWSGDIRLDDPARRAVWFTTFKAFVLHYAELAQVAGTDSLVIGTELGGTTKHTREWRATIRAARKLYHGPLTYASNHSGEEMRVMFWNALDYIGVDAYYPLTNHAAPTPAELEQAWRARARAIGQLSHKWHKKVLFTEIGYMSRNATNRTPWFVDISEPVPQGAIEQGNCYHAALSVMERYPWWSGAMWWDWRADDGTGFTPRNKPAESVLLQHWN